MNAENLPMSHQFFLGVIEGFYGRSYCWQQRQQLIQFLSEHGYHAYCYAPKSQRQLRMGWKQPFSSDDFNQLQSLAKLSKDRGVEFGLGFSPWGLQKSYDANDQQALQKKIDELNRIDADWLCILFDDMPGDNEELAEKQLHVMHEVLRYSTAKRFTFCPTYYSYDPVLEKLFGTRPESYWRQLGQELPKNVDVFWTGNNVVSTAYSEHDFADIAEQLQRKPMLWDNYPVNDGRIISNFLHLDLFPNRPSSLKSVVSGHVVNPMNQFSLSLPVLSALPAKYSDSMSPENYWKHVCVSLGGESLWRLLERDKQRFQQEGLSSFSEDDKQHLIKEYQQQGSPPALEVVAWLSGEYAFDPACLTD